MAGGSIVASYAGGSVDAGSTVGGLVGRAEDSSFIGTSHAGGNVTGSNNAGGLVGSLNGTMVASYAAGDVGISGNVGGLVGEISHSDETIASYARGAISGSDTSYVGGLIGLFIIGSFSNSYNYWDAVGATRDIGGVLTVTSGATISTSDTADAGRTTMQLQTPTNDTANTGIYENWNMHDVEGDSGFDVDADGDSTVGTDSDPDVEEIWDFGTDSQYPALKVDFNGDGEATACEFGGQGRGTYDPLTRTCE